MFFCCTWIGVLDIDSYCLPDMPSSERRHLVSAIKPTVKIPIANRSKSAKPPRHVTISSRTEIMNKEFPETAEKEMILRTSSAKRVPGNLNSLKNNQQNSKVHQSFRGCA